MAYEPAQVGDWQSNKQDTFGGMTPGNRSRQYLLNDLKKMETGGLGMSASQKNQAVDSANTTAAVNIQGQAKDLGQASLAAGPMSAVSGRAAQTQRDAAAQLANAGALASAETEKTSQALAEQQRQAIRGGLEREQDRNRQDTQFWVSTLLNPQYLTGAANVAATVGKGANPEAGATEAAPAIPSMPG